MAATYTLEEVKKHNSEESCWIIVSGKVYDVTKFLKDHPGGKRVLLKAGGTDATKPFENFHNAADVMRKYGQELYIGDVGASGSSSSSSSASSTPSLSPIPFGELNMLQGWHSPYFNASHEKFRVAVRAFIDREIAPHVHKWDEAKALPKELYGKLYQAGMLPGFCGGAWPEKYAGSNVAGGIKPSEFGYFHEQLLIDEMCRPGSGGLIWGCVAGLSIGLPPVLHFGSQAMKDRVCGPVLRGEKLICLAITEPSAGSDVANLKTEAKLTPDGKHYILNGEKKWITNGVWADFFTVACRTGGPGMGGVSLLLVERSMPGVTTRPMNCMGVWSSGTTYITFEDVKVPAANIIGEENQGFKLIMHNFNHERWGTCVQGIRLARVCLEDAWAHSLRRKTFGKTLMEHPVIRSKLANMARQVEAAQAWLDSLTYQLSRMSHAEANTRLGGSIALLKAHMAETLEFCAREAAQVFGGLAYTRGGQGGKVERIYREVRAYAIPAGSTEIMLDQGVKMAHRQMLKQQKKQPRL